MSEHAFAAGQRVVYEAGSLRPRGVFEITALLPVTDGSPMYQIKSDAESHKRMAAEHELRPSLGAPAGLSEAVAKKPTSSFRRAAT
jgi:hypothetical protein